MSTSSYNNKLLYSKQEAMTMLDVGERTFRGLLIPYVKVGKSKKYRIADLQAWINSQAENPACLSPAKGKARHIIGTTSRSAVIGIEEARRQIALNRQNLSLQN